MDMLLRGMQLHLLTTLLQLLHIQEVMLQLQEVMLQHQEVMPQHQEVMHQHQEAMPQLHLMVMHQLLLLHTLVDTILHQLQPTQVAIARLQHPHQRQDMEATLRLLLQHHNTQEHLEGIQELQEVTIKPQDMEAAINK
jgi:hypothetical protein